MSAARTRLTFVCMAVALSVLASAAFAAQRPGQLPLTASGTQPMALGGEAAFQCGTYKGNQSEHAWRKSLNERVQSDVKAGRLMQAGSLDYVYDDVWIIEDDGTLAYSGNNLFDTNGQTHRYAPAGGGVYNITSIAPTFDFALGLNISPGDDGAVTVNLLFNFAYAGSNWAQVRVSGNGAVSFGAALNPLGFYDSADFFSEVPKIAPLYLDLNPQAGGTVSAKSEATKCTITWSGVPEYGTGKLNTIQLVLYNTGVFTITYNGIASTSQNNGLPVIVGYHPGGSPLLQQVNFSALPFNGNAGSAVYEEYFSYVNPLVNEVALLNRFYDQFSDDYFQLVFFTNFTQTMGGFANELNIKNDVTGIGLGIFDASVQYGSNGVLESRCNMNSIDVWNSDPAARVHGRGNNFLTIMGQEAGHRWGAFTYFNSGGGASNLILGRDDAHWSYYADIDHSSLEGGNWVSTGGSNYQCPTQVDYFSQVDEYMFGLRTADEVKDFFYISSAANNQLSARDDGTPTLGATATGTYTPVTIEHIIAAEGARTPTVAAENKDLRQGFIFLIKAGTTPSPAQLTKIANFRRAWEDYFEKSTDGRFAVNTSLTATYPVAVVCGHVRDATTTEIVNEFTATSVERGFVQHVPDKGRYTFRYMANASSGPAEAITIQFAAPGYLNKDLVLNVNYGTTQCQEVSLTPIYTGADVTPLRTELFENHPNPFNPSTTIRYRLATPGASSITIFDASGARVRTLMQGTHSAGEHSVTFDGRDDNGHTLASGVYFYRLEAPGFTQTRKMVLLK